MQELYPGIKIRRSMKLTPLYKGDMKEIDHFEFFVNGRRIAIAGTAEQLPLDVENLAGGHHELRVVAVKAGDIETQGRTIIPIQVLKENQQVLMSIKSPRIVHWDKQITVHAQCDGAEEILIVQNSRPLERKAAAKGTFQIDPLTLGSGAVSLFAVGILNGKQVRSQPVTLEIIPPEALPATHKAMPENAAEGLRLKHKVKTAIIADTHSAKWLEEQKLPVGSEFELTGLFEVTADDIYQFQINTNCSAVIAVDGVELKSSGEAGWNYLPIHLQKGVHTFLLKGKTLSGQPRLRVCFGGEGTYSLTGKTFQHLPTATAK